MTTKPVNTTPRSYRAADRPRVVIRGWEKEELYLVRINSQSAYFRGPHYVGEMAVPAEDVVEIKED